MAAELRNDVLCVKGESRECFELRGEEVFDEPKVEFFGGTAADGEHHNLEEALVEMAGGQRKHVDSTDNKRRRKGYSSSSSSLLSLLSLLLSFVSFLL